MTDVPERIDPSRIPRYTGNLGELEHSVGALTNDAGRVEGLGSEIHQRFGDLRDGYTAPEGQQLFATTQPVQQHASQFAGRLRMVASAISAYASEIRPIVQRLEQLRAEAQAFVATLGEGDDWRHDGDKVDRNEAMVREVGTLVVRFHEAERRAMNAIRAQHGAPPVTASDGSRRPNTYGFDAASMERSIEAGQASWGRVVEEDHRWWELGHHAKRFVWDGFLVDGVGGTLVGLNGLAPWSDGWTDAWKNLGKLAIGTTLLTPTPLLPIGLAAAQYLPEDKGGGLLRSSLGAVRDTGKALVAWDTWGDDPARAAGAVTFNAATIFATRGAGGAIRGASTGAKAAAIAGRVGAFVDPMTYLGKGAGMAAGGLSRVGSVLGRLGDTMAIPGRQLPNGNVHLPDGSAVPPNFRNTDLPPGRTAVRMDDGSVRIPRNPEVPGSGGVLDPFTGNVVRPDLQVETPTGRRLDPPAELSARDRAMLSGPETPEPALTGARQTPPPGTIAGQADNNLNNSAGGPSGPGPSSGQSGGPGGGSSGPPGSSGSSGGGQGDPPNGSGSGDSGGGDQNAGGPQAPDPSQNSSGAPPSGGPPTTPPPVDPQLQAKLEIYDALGDTAPVLDIDAIERAYPEEAHTKKRHSPDVPMRPGDPVPPGLDGRTIEGRIYGIGPWEGGAANYSYRWIDHATMRDATNTMLAEHWERIRSDLALEGEFEGTFRTTNVTGEGFYNGNLSKNKAQNPPYSVEHRTNYFTMTLRLDHSTQPPSIILIRSFPTGGFNQDGGPGAINEYD